MTTKIGRNARLLALLALVAVLPLGIWACDAGDSPDGPTGPSSTYNPDVDYPGAKITAKASDSTPTPGQTFTVLAYFADGNGRPVQGIPLKIWAEAGGQSAPYFSYQTNPTLTGANGGVSINVIVSASCPEGSYAFVIAPASGPNVKGYVGVEVSGTGPNAITSVEIISGPTSPNEGDYSTYRAEVVANCTYTLQFSFGAGWQDDIGSDGAESYTWTMPGEGSVVARAQCAGTDWVYSDPYIVSVQDTP